MAIGNAAPSSAVERIEAMDVLRGVALFGILLMNITAFGLPWPAYVDPTVYGGAEGADLWSWIVLQMGFEGTQRGLFSLLFGAGVVLFTSRLEKAGRADVADIYFRRNLWLIVFGVIHAYLLLWPGEILFMYGVVALFLYAFRKMAAKHLIMIGAAALLFHAAWGYVETRHALDVAAQNAAAEAVLSAGGELTPGQASAQQEWKALVAEHKPDEDVLKAEVEAHRGGYFTVLLHQVPMVRMFESLFFYRHFFDMFSMMLFGMALFKLGVLTLQQKASVYVLMAAIGYSIGLTINYFETVSVLRNGFSLEAILQGADISGSSYELGRIAMTFGHVGALLLFCQSGVLPWLRHSLAAVGRMALTNYVSQSIICAFVFYGFGLGLYGTLQRHQLYYVVFAIWVFQLIVSPLWLARFRFGPLEWVWRALTYGYRPSMRNPVPGVVPSPAL